MKGSIRPSVRSGTAPKYGVVADTLRQRIRRGTWPPGTRVPSLHLLAEEFGVARLTARQAVQVLVQEGLLSARQGQGTFVTDLQPSIKNIKVQTTLQALSAMYVETPPDIRTITETVGPLPPHKAQDDTPYVRLRRVHSDNNVAYCVITVHIDAAVFARAPKRFRKQAAIPVLLSLDGISIARAHQTLTVGTADAEVAALLAIPVNAPVAFVERTFENSGGHIVYFAEVIYRGEAVRLDIELTV